MLREVLPEDLVEPEAEPEDLPVSAPAVEVDAVYVGGVRMDEYGEFIDDYDDGFGTAAYRVDDGAEPALPGLTDEALRLLAVAREELDASELPVPVVPLAVSGFLTSRKKATAAVLADWIDGPAGRAS